MTDQMKTEFGYVRCVSEHEWYLQTDDDRFLRLRPEGPELPIGQRIALALPVTPDMSDGSYSVDTTNPKAFSYAPAVSGYIGGTRRHIGLWRKIEPSASDATIAKHMHTAQQWAWEMEKFWKHYARHAWDISVSAYPLLSNCSADSPEFCRTAIRNYKQANGVDVDYHHTHDRFSNGNYCGLAYISDVWGATYEGCTVKTAIHEIGHNFGLRHSNTPDEEYGDLSGVMGKSQSITGLLSPNLISLQLDDERTRSKVDETIQLLLAPIELSKYALHDDEHQNVVVYSPGYSPYYLSLRKAKGWPYIYREDREDSLFVHTKTSEGKTILMDELRPGDTALQLNNTKIEYLEYSNETARVNIIINANDPVVEQTMPSGFPAPIDSVTVQDHHTGLWYDPDFNGQGFDVQVRNGRVTVMWYTFNQGESSRRYYTAAGDIGQDLDLYTTEKGTFADPTTASLVPAGKCRMYFFDDVTGVFSYATPEHGRGAIEVHALADSSNPATGLYFDPSRNREGFSVQIQDDLNTATAYWYTYGKNPYFPGQPSYKKNVTQRWFLCHGERGSADNYLMTIYEVLDGKWMDFDRVTIMKVGTALLKIEDENTLRFSYSIAADSSVTGDGSMSLSRLL